MILSQVQPVGVALNTSPGPAGPRLQSHIGRINRMTFDKSVTMGDGKAGARRSNRSAGPRVRKYHPSILDAGCTDCHEWYANWIKEMNIVRMKLLKAMQKNEHIYDHSNNRPDSSPSETMGGY